VIITNKVTVSGENRRHPVKTGLSCCL